MQLIHCIRLQLILNTPVFCAGKADFPGDFHNGVTQLHRIFLWFSALLARLKLKLEM